MEAIMSIIGVVIVLLVCVMVWTIRESTVAPASVNPAATSHHRPHFVLSEPNGRTADQEELRRYFLQGRPDGLRRVFP
jgi:hypothetical protein